MNSKFNLLNKTYFLIEYYNKLLINYPKKLLVLSQSIEKTMYDLIEKLFAFNINDVDRIKQKYLKDYTIKLSMLDFYSRISYSKKIISKRQFEVIGRIIIELRKMSCGLLKNEKDEY